MAVHATYLLYVGDTQGRLSRLHRSDGRVLAIRTADGAIRWSVATGNPIYASPLVHHAATVPQTEVTF